jgi:RNA polymerase sigma-70 factor (ECF subfamily)
METRASLIQRVRDKADSSAWGEFFSVYQPLLYAYIRQRGVSGPDADDVVQDVFAKLTGALARFEYDAERGRFRTWLWRVAHNALADWGRRRVIRDRAEQEWIDQHPLADGGDSDAQWNELYRRRILQVAIDRVRATAQPTTWACFEGRILADRPAAEVAAEACVSVNAVYVNASRLLARVREECAAFEESLAGHES